MQIIKRLNDWDLLTYTPHEYELIINKPTNVIKFLAYNYGFV